MTTTTLRIETYAAYGTAAAIENAARTAAKAALVCATPLIGLAFVVLVPFAGLAALAWLGAKAFAAEYPGALRAARNVTLFVAAPFIGLAYAALLPFVGLGALVWVALKHNA